MSLHLIMRTKLAMRVGVMGAALIMPNGLGRATSCRLIVPHARIKDGSARPERRGFGKQGNRPAYSPSAAYANWNGHQGRVGGSIVDAGLDPDGPKGIFRGRRRLPRRRGRP